MSNKDIKNYTLLPGIENIKNYTVEELKTELSTLKEFTNMNSESKVFQTSLYICQLISINEKKFTTDEFLEYKNKESSNFMLGNIRVTNGAVAILTVATVA